MEVEGRITIAATIVGTFSIDGNFVYTQFHEDITINHMRRKVTIVLTDGSDLEEVIRRTSKYGYLVSLDYEPHFDKDDEKFGHRQKRPTKVWG